MKICYRDEIGIVQVVIDLDRNGIGFDGQYAYFNDLEGQDYRVPTKDIIWIGKEEY